MIRKLRLVTRGSALALCQTELARLWLSERLEGVDFEIIKITTVGDRKTEWSLQKEGGTGLFTKELEDILLRGEADIAIHSAKDMPSKMPDGLKIAGYLPREDVRDVLILREGIETPKTIATGSPRRRAQLEKRYPEAEWQELRGNVGTRLRKIAEGEADATVLARAGLNRLNIDSHEGLRFIPMDVSEMIPAVGQGAVALQCANDLADELSEHLHQETARALHIERQFLIELGVGCHAAFAAHWEDEQLRIYHEDKAEKLEFEFPWQGYEDSVKKVREICQTL